MLSSAPPISLTDNARRPDAGGTQGRPLQVKANFFAIKQLPVDTVWHYDVAISPELPVARARALWREIEKLDELAKSKTVFDGRCNAYSASELNLGKTHGITRKVILPDGTSKSSSTATTTSKSTATGQGKGQGKGKGQHGKGQQGTSQQAQPSTAQTESTEKRSNEFTVKISIVNRIELEELHRFLSRQGPLTPSCLTAIQALNIAMSHKVFSEMVSSGRSAFTPANARNLGGGVEKWDGISQSVRAGQGNLYANIDVASTAFVKGGNATAIMADVKRLRSADDLPRTGLTQPDISGLRRLLKGCSFTVTHRGAEYKRRFKVADVSTQPASKITFDQTLNNGSKKKMTIPQYYAEAYNYKLRYPHLPCIAVRGKDSTLLYFPAEVCVITPGQKYTKKLNPDQTAEMIKGTCLKPVQREAKIMDNVNTLKLDSNEYLKSFGVEVAKTMTVVPARVLPPPPIVYARNEQTTPQFGGWKLDRTRKMYQGSRLSSWGVLVFESEHRLPRHFIESFIRELTQTIVENGMQVTQMNPPIIYAQGMEVPRNVDTMWSTIQGTSGAPPQMILVVLPSVCPIYSNIKTYCETSQNGKMTQCVLANKIRKPNNKQYCGMLGLKINAKLGGVNNTVPMNAIRFCTDVPTLVIGADVTHPAPGETSRPSVCAVVGSMDRFAFKYAGRLQAQNGRVEIIERLKYLVHDLIQAFIVNNGNHRPRRILFYRDGVSEGQYAEVMRSEVAAVKEACRHIDPNYNPPVTFCIVKKRHHARFFPMSDKDADRSGNCLAGTVVDKVITHPTEFDFYLQSHGGLQGTSRPTLYHVICDENRFTSDHFQTLTYNLCHIYSRCPKAVSIVPAVYYAHLLAYRARHYQGGDFSDTESSASGSSGSAASVSFETSNEIKNRMYFV
ncbi:Eukaryotic translation initiation factor 2C [Podila epigama]|nr:Eukaryotic translation initiation factor 2C [Podila epigama]